MRARRVGPCPECGAARPVIRGHQVAPHLIVERRGGQLWERRCLGSSAPSPADQVLRRHAAGELTEGQAARVLGLDRVDLRERSDAWLDANQHRHPELVLVRRDWVTTWEAARE